MAPKTSPAFTELLWSFQREMMPKKYKLRLYIFLPSNKHSSLTKLPEVEFSRGVGLGAPFPALSKASVQTAFSKSLALSSTKRT